MKNNNGNKNSNAGKNTSGKNTNTSKGGKVVGSGTKGVNLPNGKEWNDFAHTSADL